MKALVLGGGGFIGNHMVTRLKKENYEVHAVDLKKPEFSNSLADQFFICDLRDQQKVNDLLLEQYDEIYQFAADMGGAGFVFTGSHDAEIMHNSATINLNVLESVKNNQKKLKKIFYSSSACMYPEHNQLDPENPNCTEASAYPANPDSEYGWEKLFSERLFLAYNRNFDIPIAIARFHNIYGPYGTYDGGREKAPAALCRKIAMIEGDSGEIEIWGDGKQTRSFLYIDDCIEAVRRLVSSNFMKPLNIGSEEIISINELALKIGRISNKKVLIKNIPGPQGVRGRNSDNTLIKNVLGWNYEFTLERGLESTFAWINEKVSKSKINF